jgi:membrane fusion protein (multidrug efflux system)
MGHVETPGHHGGDQMRETSVFSSGPVHSRLALPPLLAVAAALLLLLVTACGGSPDNASASTRRDSPAAQAPPEEDSIAVRVDEVRVAALSSIYSTSATLRADKQAVVTARTGGVVRKLVVEEGDRVDAGQPLAYLENDEQTIEFQRASSVRETRVREYERARRLHEQELMSEEEFETVRREWEEAVHAADLAELLLSRTVIRAPFRGRILRRYIDVGATVSNGTEVYDLADLDPLYADVNVPEQHVPRLQPGQRVRLIADPTGESTPARIERIAPVVETTTGTVKVTLAVDGASDLRPGSFTRVEIVTDTHEEALVVARSALVAEGRRWYLFRLAQDGSHVERLEVVRGYEEGERVEVLETVEAAEPLGRGDRVVVVGASALTDGAAVQVMEAAEAQNAARDEDDGRVAA